MPIPRFEQLEGSAVIVGDHLGISRDVILLVANQPTRIHVLREASEDCRASVWVMEREAGLTRYLCVASQRGDDAPVVDIVLPVPPMVKRSENPLAVLSDYCERFGSPIDCGKYHSHLVTNFEAPAELVLKGRMDLRGPAFVGCIISKDDDPQQRLVIIAFMIDLAHLTLAFEHA